MTPPSSIAHYKITAKLGEGGMGAVYRATDTKLNREVAIKVLPDALANDPDHLARFTREAQVLASLNHTRNNVPMIAQKAINGAAQEEILSQAWPFPNRTLRNADRSRDGRYLVSETGASAKTGSDIWTLPLTPDANGERKPVAFAEGHAAEQHPRVSPDSRWLAYSAGNRDLHEVYVETFPTPGGEKHQISNGGGSRPVWSRDGKELYYIASDGKLMAVSIKINGSKFEAGTPQALFHAGIGRGLVTSYDVSKVGRFLIPVESEQGIATPFTVVVNWAAGLKK